MWQVCTYAEARSGHGISSVTLFVGLNPELVFWLVWQPASFSDPPASQHWGYWSVQDHAQLAVWVLGSELNS